MPILETVKTIKEYGTLAVCVISMYWFSNKLYQQDEKIERIENKLYDCFEERIKENTRINRFGVESAGISKVYAILPEETKIIQA